MKRATACFLVAAATLTVGCASTASESFSGAGDVAAVRAALARSSPTGSGPTNVLGQPMAFVVTGSSAADSQIVAFDLKARTVLWQQPADPVARLAVGRNVVVYAQRGDTKDGDLVVRDVATGAVRWQKKLSSALGRVGFAVDGDRVYESTEAAGARGGIRSSELGAYDAASGAVRWRVRLEGDAGGPAARGGLVFVPRRSQYVTIIDGVTGVVLANILSREEAASFVKALPEGLFFGSRGIFLASAESAFGSRQSGAYLQAVLPPFVRPLYHWDMYRTEQVDYSAVDRNRLLWRVVASPDKATFAQGLVVVHNFRFLFGVDAALGTLRWAYNHPRLDMMASDHTGQAIVFVSSDGAFGAVDARTGQHTYEARLPQAAGPVVVRGATFDADGFEAPAGGASEAPQLTQVLSSIAWDPDARFTDVKLFAIDQLSRAPGKDVTGELLKALEGDELSPRVLDRAVDALVARQDPSALNLYIEGLRVHPDYAEDRKPKRLDVYARAVTALKAKAAIPALVEHLRLPDTDLQFIREIADAVLATESRESLGAFEDFLLQYRADPAFTARPGALLAASEVLIKLGGVGQEATLLFIVDEPKTIEPLRAYIQRALAAASAAE